MNVYFIVEEGNLKRSNNNRMVLTVIRGDHLWSLLEWEYAWPCWSFSVRVYLRWTWTPSWRRVFHCVDYQRFPRGKCVQRAVLNLSTLLSLPLDVPPSSFFSKLSRRIVLNMAVNGIHQETTSLRVFRGELRYFMFVLYETVYSPGKRIWSPNNFIVCYPSHACCHMNSLIVTWVYRFV